MENGVEKYRRISRTWPIVDNILLPVPVENLWLVLEWCLVTGYFHKFRDTQNSGLWVVITITKPQLPILQLTNWGMQDCDARKLFETSHTKGTRS